ncbi:MAG: hypothetical protein WCR46_10725 [Deltaproteobacteria bacterium]
MSDISQKSQLLIYEAENGAIKIRNIYAEGELVHEATHKEFLSVRREGLREVERSRDFYNLDSHAQQHYDTFHQQRLVEQSFQPDDFDKAIPQLLTSKPRRKKKGDAK